jgi:hypothetical protein
MTEAQILALAAPILIVIIAYLHALYLRSLKPEPVIESMSVLEAQYQAAVSKAVDLGKRYHEALEREEKLEPGADKLEAEFDHHRKVG